MYGTTEEIRAVRVTNVMEITSVATDFHTSDTPGASFNLLLIPKSGSGVENGDWMHIDAILPHSNNAVIKVPVQVGVWSEVVFHALKGGYEAYTLGGLVIKGKYYTNSGKSYVALLDVNEYDETTKYNLGEFSIKADTLYECTTAVEEPEDFDSEKWTEVASVTSMVSKGIFAATGGPVNLTKVEAWAAPIKDLLL